MSEAKESIEGFELLGGHLCLDFINTLSERPSGAPLEMLNTYTDLLAWSRLTNILDAEKIQQLQALAEKQPEQAANWLVEIKRARELLFQIFSTIAGRQTARTEDMGQFNLLLSETMAHMCLVPGDDGFLWHWASERDQLERPLWFIIRDAADLLTSPELRHVRICASEDCDWLFLDTSKNHSRRWCDMKSCGNRAKARRYYGRKSGPKEVSEA